MPKIELLAPEVASRIAAGEVIERPASMLKELLENALDAGAAKITVESIGAGRKLLRVVDDGSGMDAEDCTRCLERHATSKIKKLSDLQKLNSFGFRGEALYAIAAVSKLTITSAIAGSKNGWAVAAEGGNISSGRPASAVRGTTVEVRDLFFNTPARHKFLKSDPYEKGKLAAVIEEAALANPEISFVYKSENREHLRFAAERPEDPVEALRRRAAAVLGPDLAKGLLTVLGERGGFKLTLFVSPPDRMSPSRGFQYWFVNKRPVESRLLQQALYKAFEELRSRDRHPVCAAHLELSPDSFDVNVHPGKREVRFSSDRDIFELVSGLIRSTLARSKMPSPITVQASSFSADRPSTAAVAEPPAHYLGGRSFFPQEQAFAFALSDSSSPNWYTPPFRFLGQIERAYLVFEANGGLFVIDQHAAQERILFERFLGEIEGGKTKSQKLMLPIPLELPASAVSKVLSHKQRLGELGFEIAPFGKTTLHVLAVPAMFHKREDLKEMAHRLVDSYGDPLRAAQDARAHAVATIACKAAVKAHDPLGEKEALRLIEDLKDCKDGSCCPHGRRAILALSREELARRFQRPGAPPL